MPYGNGRGPEGRGPMTGRKLGYCNGYEMNGYQGSFGGGHGMGRRFRNRYFSETHQGNEANQDRLNEILDKLDNVSRRLENLEMTKGGSSEDSSNI
ncbi:DUF5320 domain-containing protein [Myxococcota bacterium]|nr:DUF5320 domain-containing protein [Myxococcota bacterium]MBU1379691.1 DUF5320 domain-containing protein [Myxococcota bacterium]MBU1496902.1 DUF5320 domain-containing protein [Myxococcota bacterium]